MSDMYKVRDIADRLNVTTETALQLMHQKAFGPRGKGYLNINPHGRRPTYRVTAWGWDHYLNERKKP